MRLGSRVKRSGNHGDKGYILTALVLRSWQKKREGDKRTRPASNK